MLSRRRGGAGKIQRRRGGQCAHSKPTTPCPPANNECEQGNGESWRRWWWQHCSHCQPHHGCQCQCMWQVNPCKQPLAEPLIISVNRATVRAIDNNIVVVVNPVAPLWLPALVQVGLGEYGCGLWHTAAYRHLYLWYTGISRVFQWYEPQCLPQFLLSFF